MNVRPPIASLDNPLYYLENFRGVVTWVLAHHADLLTEEEKQRLQVFTDLPCASQGLLVRMVMRKGVLFRLGKLDYPELECSTTQAATPLIEAGWLDPAPQLGFDALTSLFLRSELIEIFAAQLTQAGLDRHVTLRQLRETLAQFSFEDKSLDNWWPACGETVVEILHASLFERLRLMFFGNLHQDWSEFVLSELGRQRFEVVAFTPDSRAFSRREEVDCYLLLHRCRERLDNGESVTDLWAELPRETWDNPWLEERRARLVFALGHTAERSGDIEQALEFYAQSEHGEALVRRLRVMERQQAYSAAWPLLRRGLQNSQNGAQKLSLQRIEKRLAKKLGKPASDTRSRPDIPVRELRTAQKEEYPVEVLVARCMSDLESPCYYVENTLLNGLFGLLCWEALFAPLKGAFFHPFHTRPADLYRKGFVERRREIFDQCLRSLDDGSYVERIRRIYADKQGLSCNFLHWEVLDPDLLELALKCIPAAHLKLIFARMLDDLRHHRSGLPDLVRFEPKKRRYEMIEVKGPGDRLQDNQRRWFEFFLRNEIPASVCRVSWTEAD